MLRDFAFILHAFDKKASAFDKKMTNMDSMMIIIDEGMT